MIHSHFLAAYTRTPESLAYLSRMTFLVGLLTVTAAKASTEAHVHSVASLGIVQEGENLLMELNSPLANLTGFEYQPRNMAEHTQVNQAIIRLRDSKRQFQFAGWDCQLKDIEVIRPWREVKAKQGSNEQDHPNAHEQEHENDHHKEHDGEHEHSHSQEHSSSHHANGAEHDEDGEHDDHSDLQVHYHFACDNVGSKQEISVLLFNDFPLIEEITVEWISSNGAGTTELTPAANQLKL